MKTEQRYLFHLQFLGFRFHGWAKQTGLKTVHQMVDKTLAFIFEHENFKTLGSSRTDSKVSANYFMFELILPEGKLPTDFLAVFNQNLPPDIRALKIEPTPPGFNIIQSPKLKHYVYLFSFGEKVHPFAAPYLTSVPEILDLETMKMGAELFHGTHDFRKYCTKPSANTRFEREMVLSQIQENDLYQANFFPEKTFAYHVKSKGFMRNQVRLMMGQLFALGKGEISLDYLQGTLTHPDEKSFPLIAPASGLILQDVSLAE